MKPIYWWWDRHPAHRPWRRWPADSSIIAHLKCGCSSMWFLFRVPIKITCYLGSNLTPGFFWSVFKPCLHESNLVSSQYARDHAAPVPPAMTDHKYLSEGWVRQRSSGILLSFTHHLQVRYYPSLGGSSSPSHPSGVVSARAFFVTHPPETLVSYSY